LFDESKLEIKMQLLEQILQDKENRVILIKKFQEEIWNNDNANEILSDLAYDLDFYEPNEGWRKESSSYYGDERLEQEIKLALEKLKLKG
jgi:hypothetical protein